MFELVVEKHFSAAHFLPDYPGPCSRLHGHNYRVRVYVRGEKLDKNGMVADFGEIKTALMTVLETLDHQNLNELLPFQEIPPTTEHIAQFIAHQIHPHLSVPVHRVEVWETVGQAVIFYPYLILGRNHFLSPSFLATVLGGFFGLFCLLPVTLPLSKSERLQRFGLFLRF